MGSGSSCDGITRTSLGPEGSKDTVALSGARGTFSLSSPGWRPLEGFWRTVQGFPSSSPPQAPYCFRQASALARKVVA